MGGRPPPTRVLVYVCVCVGECVCTRAPSAHKDEGQPDFTSLSLPTWSGAGLCVERHEPQAAYRGTRRQEEQPQFTPGKHLAVSRWDHMQPSHTALEEAQTLAFPFYR